MQREEVSSDKDWSQTDSKAGLKAEAAKHGYDVKDTSKEAGQQGK